MNRLLPKRQEFAISVALAAHMMLVVFGAMHTPLTFKGHIGTFLNLYSSISGASGSYSFFAPRVGSQLRLLADGVSESGQLFTHDFEAGRNREAALRMGNIVGGLWDDSVDEKTRRAVAASIAAKIFAERDDTHAVTVSLKSYYLPTMEDYRRGDRGRWQDYYSATFTYPRP